MKTLFFQESKNLFFIFSTFCIFLIFYFNKFQKNPEKVFLGWLIIICFLIWFYRVPTINVNKLTKEFIYSPSGGTITDIEELNDNYRISSFLSPLDIHVQFYPYDGKIIKQKYYQGQFNPAFYKKSKYNERMETELLTSIGIIKIIQIAGVFVRRIKTFNEIGDNVKLGELLGLIKFGSRVDLIIPKNKIELLVKKGEKIYPGITKIAKIK